jgi:hypothetical protein
MSMLLSGPMLPALLGPAWLDVLSRLMRLSVKVGTRVFRTAGA